MRQSLSKVLLLVMALAVMPATAEADLTLTGHSCFFTGLTMNPYPGFVPTPSYLGATDATACLGAFSGNNKGIPGVEDDVLLALGTAWGGSWSVVGSDLVSGELTPWTLKFSTNVFGRFVLALKAGNAFSLYHFDNPGAGGLAEVQFATDGVSSQIHALSHATLYSTGSTVPEPSTVILLGTGLLGLFGVEYRRRKKA